MARVPKVAEEAVRDYLDALVDPSKAVDWDLVQDVLDKLNASDDPYERVLLRVELREAEQPDFEPLERDFMEFAARWASANAVTGDDLAYEGVPVEILHEVGLTVSDKAQEDLRAAAAELAEELGEDDDTEVVETAGRAAAAPAGTSPFEPGTAMANVYDVMDDQPFTINDLVGRSGVSRSTVRAVIDKLDSDGRIEELEPDDSGIGRAAKRFRLTH